MDVRKSDAVGARDASDKTRSSVAGSTAPSLGKPPRSTANWGAQGGNAQQQGSLAPRLSTSGSMRRSHRHSARNSTRASQMGHGPEGGQHVLQVIDEEGVDRTPKPLLSVKPSVLRSIGAGVGGDDGTLSPMSEAGSEFFLDRMSSAVFSRGQGGTWGSGSNSGAITPTRSDTGGGGEEDYETQRERAKALAAQAEAEEKAEMERQLHAEEQDRLSSQATATPEPQAFLTEKDLEAYIDIQLTETTTDFLLVMPCVTISTESEEAASVEAANTRYTQLLANKASADKYTDQESQTLNPVLKTKEVQSTVLTTTSTGCQASPWDISDAAAGAEHAAAAAAHAAAAAGGHLPSVSQLAGAVAHGEMYGMGGGGGGGGWAGSSTAGQSYQTHGSMRHMGSMQYRSSAMRQSTAMSWAQGSVNTAVPGMMPRMSSMSHGHGQVSTSGSVADGPTSAAGSKTAADAAAAAEAAAAAAAPPDPLAELPELGSVLRLVEMALCQNTYLPKLLQYRSHTMNGGTDADSGAPSRALSQTASRAASRMASRNVSETGSQGGALTAAGESLQSRAQSLQRAMSVALSERLDVTQGSTRGGTHTQLMSQMSQQLGGGGPPPGYAPSMAESAWPEELLQDLADLGPDGVPRMESLWEWQCPLTGELQVVCMAWNKKIPDMLAVGYGTQVFSKAAAAAGMGSGCYGTPAPTTPSTAPTTTHPTRNDDSEGTDGAAQGSAGAGAGGNGGSGGGAVPIHGMVAFWSLKHPQYPLWHFRTRSGVTALDFATHQPNILAVGLYDGSVAVYDVKSQTGSPAMESDSHTGRHSDPVWKVQWIDRGHERDEPLVSISTDGRVTQWSIAKGLEYSDLMALKRVPRKATAAAAPLATAAAATAGGAANAAKGGKGGVGAEVRETDAFISRLTSGMSFDFSAKDQRIYIAGTEDGWIHRCSTSYSEQYLESYEGHMGPVYALRWSPFRPNMWASASADWTLRLWQEGRQSALLTFQSGSHEVNDVQWCPTNSTVFGSVTSGGRLEVWDFGLSTVKPVITHKAGTALSCLLFSPSSPVVVCGSDKGVVSVFRLYNVDREYDTPEEQLSRLDDVIRANVMKTQPGANI